MNEEDLYYIGGGMYRYECYIIFCLTAKSRALVAARLVIEDVEKRRRIVRSTHNGSHLGLNRMNYMVASKYYWPGLFNDIQVKVTTS